MAALMASMLFWRYFSGELGFWGPGEGFHLAQALATLEQVSQYAPSDSSWRWALCGEAVVHPSILLLSGRLFSLA